jgi:hypothetical protein
MTTETDRGRQKMAGLPFSPLPTGASHEGQVEHALNYIAFYLSEIEKHLAGLAGRPSVSDDTKADPKADTKSADETES